MSETTKVDKEKRLSDEILHFPGPSDIGQSSSCFPAYCLSPMLYHLPMLQYRNTLKKKVLTDNYNRRTTYTRLYVGFLGVKNQVKVRVLTFRLDIC